MKAVENVNKVISREIEGKCFINQRELDYCLIDLDGSPNKSKLGANATLGVSMAYARASAEYSGIPCMSVFGWQ